MGTRSRGWVLAFALALLLPRGAQAEPVAVTFDDLPSLSLTEAPAYTRITTERLVRRLRRRHVPAVGFVVGDKLEAYPSAGRAALEVWLRNGFELANHTWSHESLNRMAAETYVADIARDDTLLRPLLARRGAAPRWFRHPYLETGRTREDVRTVAAWLAAHGYRLAPVTLENADDQFALPYDEAALRHDRRAARAIRAAYLDYTARALAWYRAAALQLLGRRPALVFLLHASRLNADCMDDLIQLLARNDLRPVSLDVALADPAYAQTDDQPDPDGDDWLERWARSLGRDLPWDSFPEPPAAIVAADVRLDRAP